jgi:hydrogenase maturation protease
MTAGWSGIEPETILFGIGNSGRGDDGLGWAFLDRIQQESEFRGRIEYRYQLQVEDAALVSRAERVIFVDSYQGELPGGIQWKPCKPSKDFEFTTHVLPARAVMFLCQDLYGKAPRADLLMIQGTSWDLRIGMSPEAELRLDKALRFFKESIFYLEMGF